MTQTKGDAVDHPSHYTSHPSGVECIQITEHMGFCLGNAVKYIWRADLKHDALEDLRKARWYIEREIARRERAAKSVEELRARVLDIGPAQGTGEAAKAALFCALADMFPGEKVMEGRCRNNPSQAPGVVEFLIYSSRQGRMMEGLRTLRDRVGDSLPLAVSVEIVARHAHCDGIIVHQVFPGEASQPQPSVSPHSAGM